MAEDSEDSKAQNIYQIKLKSIRGENVSDVTMCSCVRAPFYKKASFWILKTNMASWLAQQVMNEISTKTTKQFELIIHEVIKDEKDNIEELQLVHQRQLKCIHAVNSSSGYKINTEDTNTELILTLVDYVIFDLFTKRTFNRKFKNKSAYSIINNEYKEFYIDDYGEKYWDDSLQNREVEFKQFAPTLKQAIEGNKIDAANPQSSGFTVKEIKKEED